MSGGVSTVAPGVSVLRVEPSGAGGYAFGLGNADRNSARSERVSVACRALRARTGAGTDIVLRQVGPRSISVGPRTQRAASLACPGGTAPAGAGIDLAPGGGARAAGFAGTQLSVRRATTSLRSFSFGVRNSGATARTVTVSGNCITVLNRPGAPRERMLLKLITLRRLVDRGRHQIRRSCPRGWLSLATGYRLPAASLSLEGSAAVAGAGHWSVTNAGGDSTRLILQLVCARLG